ncbi:hypothetical protein [Paenibacillus montanisoli]|uniref:Glycosyl hydrolase family 4 C-terminal domain-containing protein n=1 Tax=Paenibacillus montanisoli TaxID=2081970 RepID=A0A328TY00_9BACL|nr:hypothetical protein [Paenibacillus montanisoli]RAP73565.1 hypothetical protein DL346_25125 [Paenibacillus montanisoli]
MKPIKISIIGAGSSTFAIGMVRDICLTPSLEGSTIHFMDINQERLDNVHALCTKYAEERGVKLDLKKTLDRRECLEGADFVINTALTAGYGRMREGWEIAMKHGYKLGGSYHILYDEAFWINYYQLKFFESLTEDILDICPDAWHLMLANPVITGVTHVMRKYPQAKVVGLCHGYVDTYNVAKALGLEKKDITYQVTGVNHHLWLTDFYYKGEDAFPLLDKWIEEKSEAFWAAGGENWPFTPKRIDLYKKHGVFAIGDTASWSSASWPWWYHTDEAEERRWSENPMGVWNRFFDNLSDSMGQLQRAIEDPSVKVTELFPPVLTDELMIPLIESIACDIPRVFVVNTLNSGNYVPGIPTDFQVEVSALCSKRGIQPISNKGLPKPIVAHILRDRVAPIELELEAFNKGSRDMLLELVLTDKWSGSAAQANAFLDEILALPYHRDMAEHYR